MAEIRVAMPDNLTTWRLTVRAVARDSTVGEQRTTVLTSTPLVIRPLLPRRLIQGDTLLMAATVHNYDVQAQDIVATLTAENLVVHADAAQRIRLEAGEVQVVTWPVSAKAAGPASVLFRANGAIGDDAVTLPLTVERMAARDLSVFSGDFEGARSSPLNDHPMR